MLGLCTVNMQDDELTMRTCQAEFEAKFRKIIITDDFDDFEREWLSQDVKRLVWPGK